MAIKKRRPVSTESLCQCDLQKKKKMLVTIKEEKKINCISPKKKIRNY